MPRLAFCPWSSGIASRTASKPERSCQCNDHQQWLGGDLRHNEGTLMPPHFPNSQTARCSWDPLGKASLPLGYQTNCKIKETALRRRPPDTVYSQINLFTVITEIQGPQVQPSTGPRSASRQDQGCSGIQKETFSSPAVFCCLSPCPPCAHTPTRKTFQEQRVIHNSRSSFNLHSSPICFLSSDKTLKPRGAHDWLGVHTP